MCTCTYIFGCRNSILFAEINSALHHQNRFIKMSDAKLPATDICNYLFTRSVCCASHKIHVVLSSKHAQCSHTPYDIIDGAHDDALQIEPPPNAWAVSGVCLCVKPYNKKTGNHKVVGEKHL